MYICIVKCRKLATIALKFAWNNFNSSSCELSHKIAFRYRY